MGIICTREEFDHLLGDIKSAKAVCLDTETTGLHPFKGDRLCGVGVALDEKEAWYLPFRHEGEFYEGGNLDEDWLRELIIAIVQVQTLVGYNLKFDLKMLAIEGFTLMPYHRLVDVLLMARLVVPEQHPVGGLGLQAMEERFIAPGAGKYNTQLKEWMQKNKLWIDKPKVGPPVRKFHHVPINTLGNYCCKDVIGTTKLKRLLQRRIVETGQIQVWKNEVEVTWDFFRAETTGVAIDLEYCKNSIQVVSERMDAIVEEVKALTGFIFNFNSNPQITKVMNGLGIISPVLTKGGKTGTKKVQSWGKDALKAIGKGAHPALKLIREWLTLRNLRGTYLEEFLATGGILYGSFNQGGTITGRVSSVNPNLQNIPALIQGTAEEGDDEVIAHHETLASMLGDAVAANYTIVGKEYTADAWDEADGSMVAARRALIPREGRVFIRADFDQMEMLVFLIYVNNRELLAQVEQSYLDGKPLDFHNFITKLVWDLEPGDEDFVQYRKAAKALNFSIIYGAGITRIAKDIGVTKPEAEEFQNQYFTRLMGSKAFISRVQEAVEARGWVKNLYDRRYVMDRQTAYKAVNYLVQGSCADFLKERMTALRPMLIEEDACILLQVHDELVIEAPAERAVEIAWKVKAILEERIFTISLPTSIDICTVSWIVGDKLQPMEVMAA